MFLRLAAWGRKANGLQDLPQYNAALGLSIVATMNFFTLAMLIEFIAGRRDLLPSPKLTALIVWFSFVVVHYLTLVRSYDPDRMKDLGESTSTRWPWEFLLYLAGSVIAYLSLLSLRAAGFS
jgi:hypothetical protein